MRVLARCAGVLGVLLAACGGGGGGGGPAADPVPGAQAVLAGAASLTVALGAPLALWGQASHPQGQALAYAWDFDGDGVADSSAQSPIYIGTTQGRQTLRLTVLDVLGQVQQATLQVFVGDAAGAVPPAVCVRADALHPQAPAVVQLEAWAIDPDGGSIVDYAWDLDGDGQADVSGPEDMVFAGLPAHGPQRISVRVTDDEGQDSTATLVVSPCPTGSYAEGVPGAGIEAPDGMLVTPTATALRLRARGSDLDGGAAGAVSWDLDGDGVFGDATGRDILASFSSEGTHWVRVRIVDEEGSVGEAEAHVVVQDAPADGPPAALARTQSLLVAPGTPVQFHATAHAPSGQVLRHSWDFDGDGEEDASSTNPVFAFALPGIYRPLLTVTDEQGRRSTSDLTLCVERCDAGLLDSFRYHCPDVLLLHGGTGALSLSPVPGQPATATTYSLLEVRGTVQEDEGAQDLLVSDPSGPALPPAIGPLPVPASGIVTVEVESVDAALDGPTRLVPYTLRARLLEAGVRVQVVHCRVYVLHDAVKSDLFRVAFTDNYRGLLRAWVDTAPLAALPAPLPRVYQVEFLFADFTPDILELTPLGSAFLQAGWTQGAVSGGHAFTTTTTPVPLTGAASSWQFDYDTNVGAGRGPTVTAGRVTFRDASGRRIGRQALVLR